MPPASQWPTWRFLVDGNLPSTVVQALQAFEWQAEHTQDAGLRGRPDSEVFAYAQALRGVANSSLRDTLVIVAASQVLVYR